jgi:hypothetical protein
MTFLVATPRHLFNPPVAGSHASVCKINTDPTGLESLEPRVPSKSPINTI